MPDVFTPVQRSKVMARIAGRNTKPEILVRSMLHHLGYRFTVNGPWNRQLPGRPDIVLPKHSTVILVHGCFWHAHDHCEYFRLPKTRRRWWKNKLDGNKARDRRKEAELVAAGWHVVTIWECTTRTKADREWLLAKLPEFIE
jgi:DNA mismatch endonuclease (patch repair protein)